MKTLIYCNLIFIIFFFLNSCLRHDKEFLSQKKFLEKYSIEMIKYNSETTNYMFQLFTSVGVWEKDRKLLSVFEFTPSKKNKINNANNTFIYLITENISKDTIVEAYCLDKKLNEFIPIRFHGKEMQIDSIFYLKLPVKNDFNYHGLSLSKVKDLKTVGIWEKIDNITHKPLK